MGAAAGVVGPLMSIGSAGMGIMGSIQQGEAAKQQGQIEAIRDQTAAKAAEVRGVQTAASYDQQLGPKLSALTSMIAGKGVGVDSATSLALGAKGEQISEQQEQQAIQNQRLQQITASTDATLARSAGNNAMMASFLKSAPDAVKGLQGFYSLGQGIANL